MSTDNPFDSDNPAEKQSQGRQQRLSQELGISMMNGAWQSLPDSSSTDSKLLNNRQFPQLDLIDGADNTAKTSAKNDEGYNAFKMLLDEVTSKQNQEYERKAYFDDILKRFYIPPLGGAQNTQPSAKKPGKNAENSMDRLLRIQDAKDKVAGNEVAQLKTLLRLPPAAPDK